MGGFGSEPSWRAKKGSVRGFRAPDRRLHYAALGKLRNSFEPSAPSFGTVPVIPILHEHLHDVRCFQNLLSFLRSAALWVQVFRAVATVSLLGASGAMGCF